MDRRIEELLDELGTPADQRPTMRDAIVFDRSRSAHPSICGDHRSLSDGSDSPDGFATD